MVRFGYHQIFPWVLIGVVSHDVAVKSIFIDRVLHSIIVFSCFLAL